MTLLDRQEEFTRYLVKGFPELRLPPISFKGACAAVGNGSVENNMLPTTEGPKDHGSDAVLQWRLDRLDGPRGLRGKAAEWGWPWNTLRTQAAFFLWELYNDPRYVTLARELQEGKKSVKTLTANICKFYERPNPALANLDLRIRHAESIYMIMKPEMEPEKKGPSATTQASTGAVVVGGAGLAIANESWSTLLLALFIAAIIWVMGEKPKPMSIAEFEEESDLPSIPPLEITASETAEYDAINAHVLALEKELADAYTARETAKIRVRERANSMLAAISEEAQPALELKEPENEHNGKDDSNQLANKPTRRDLIGSVASGPV